MFESIPHETVAEVAFYGSLALFAFIEQRRPRRKDRYAFVTRWVSNFSLLTMGLLLTWLLIPGGLITLSLYAQSEGWGLLNQLGFDSALWPVLLSVLLLDLVKYWEHRLLHRLRGLWRLHVVHHADLDVDFTTTLRHHPFETLFGLGVGVIVVIALGLSPLGIFVFSVLAAVITTLSHANVRWNPTADRWLRLVFMTRDAHAVHHSARRAETDSNYAVVFIWWDYLFGTYRAAPDKGLDDFDVGVEYFRDAEDLRLSRVLTMPFRVPRSPSTGASGAAGTQRSGSPS